MGQVKCFIRIVLLAFFICPFQASSQTDSTQTVNKEYLPDNYYLIIKRDNSRVRGIIIEETDGYIIVSNIKTSKHEFIDKSDILEHKLLKKSELYTIDKYDDDYYTNYYIMTENALPFRRNGVNLTYHYGLFSNFNYCFSDHWAVTTNIFVFLPVSVGIKSSHQLGNDLYISGNAYVFGFPGSNGGYGIPLMGSAVRVTKGNSEKNFTISGNVIGYKITDSLTRAQTHNPYAPIYFVSFAYANRITKKLSLSIENMIFPQFSVSTQSINLNMTGVGLRWIRDQYEHWNFGLYGMYLGKFVNLNKKSQVLPLPYISYSTFFR